MLRIILLLSCFFLIFSSCLFSGDEQAAVKQLTNDFYLQDYSLFQKVKDANTDAVIVDASEGIINSIGWDKNFILLEQNLSSDTEPYQSVWYIVDMRGYIPSAWDKAEKLYKCLSSQEFRTKRKALGVPDSIELEITDIGSMR